jgi:hypothetical protein
LFPNIRTVIADAGHQSRKLARHLLCQDGWKLQIVKRRQRAFKITGLTWIVERSFGGLMAASLAWPKSTIEQGLRVLRAEL